MQRKCLFKNNIKQREMKVEEAQLVIDKLPKKGELSDGHTSEDVLSRIKEINQG